MTTDPISLYRLELRAASGRRIRSLQRRRRLAVTVVVATVAILVVGAAIASQMRWFGAPSATVRLHATHDWFDHLTSGFAACMAKHGAHPVKLKGGGWTYRDATAAETACGAYVTGIAATCRKAPIPPTHPTPTQATSCAFSVHRAISPTKR